MRGILDHERMRNPSGMSVLFSLSITIAAILAVVSYSNAEVVKGKVNSVQGDVIQLNFGSERGIKPGDSGRVYYTLKVNAKERPIYVAKFRISRVSEGSSTAQIQEKTTEVRTEDLVEVTVEESELEIRSEPAGARIYVDGSEVGETPLVLPRVKPGNYVVRLVREGYATYEDKVNLVEGEKKKVVASMKRAVGELSINSDPARATIYLDGKSVGMSPYEGKDLAARYYRIQISKEGYEVWEKEAVVETGKKTEVLAQLKVVEGSLEIVSVPSGAKVFIEENEIGETPLTLASMQLGQYTIRIVMEGYSPFEERVEVKAKDRRRVSAVLKKVASELVVRTEPPGAHIFIEGKPVGTTPYEGKDLAPGAYRIRIVKEGYGTWEGVLRVISGRTVEVPIELKANEGGLEVQSEPSGAKVSLDGKEVGESPLALSGIRLGQHLIRVTMEGYEPYEERVNVAEDEKKKVLVSLKKLGGDLSISTEPSGGSVYVNGKSVGLSPYAEKTLSPGTYKVRIVKEGYETWERDVVVGVGKEVEVSAHLRAMEGGLEIVSEPPGARVYVDEKEMGQTPVALSGVQLGQHLVRIVRQGYEQYEQLVSLAGGERKKVFATLQRMVGVLYVRTEPLGSDLYIDGNPVGKSPYEGKDLLPGTYRVRAIKEGYEAPEMQVTVKAGERAEVRIEMKEKKKQVAAVPPPPETKIKEVPKVTETQKGPEAPNAEKGVDWATGRCEAPVLKVGDKWTYSLFSHAYNEKRVETQEVVDIKEDVYIMKISGQDNLFAYDKKTLSLAYSIGKNGRRISSSDERFNRVFEFPFFLDKQWVNKTSDLLGLITRIHEFRVEALEEVQTPAGKFMAFKIYTLVKWSSIQKGWIRHWYSPEAKGWVKKEYDKSVAWGVNDWDAELISYELK